MASERSDQERTSIELRYADVDHETSSLNVTILSFGRCLRLYAPLSGACDECSVHSCIHEQIEQSALPYSLVRGARCVGAEVDVARLDECIGDDGSSQPMQMEAELRAAGATAASEN